MMADEPQQIHGGARRGAGRPAGSKNKLPSKASVFEARLIELVEPEYDAVVRGLLDMALRGKSETNRLKATMYLLDRLIGKAPETLEIVGDHQGTAEELLEAWKASQS